MYLTRFRFNTARTGARRLLTSPQVLHAAVMQSFANTPSLPDGTNPRVLWRLDRNASNQVLLYIVSPDQPDLTHIVEQAGWPTTGSWETFAYAPFLDKLKAGDVWTFRLTANPVHSIRTKEGEPTKRTAHITAHHQLGWLMKQQERAGFSICEQPKELPRPKPDDEYQVAVRDRRSLDFGKKGSTHNGKGNVQILTVTYEGRLRIDDVDKVRAVLTTGLGKAKAYGCGLMTLAPAQ